MQIWMSEKYEFTSLSRVSSVSHGGDGINLIKNDFKGISYSKKISLASLRVFSPIKE